MVNTPCTIRHITLIENVGGIKYTGPINRDGMAAQPLQGVADFGQEERTYFCANCMTSFDGSETFEEVKKHFGTFPS